MKFDVRISTAILIALLSSHSFQTRAQETELPRIGDWTINCQPEAPGVRQCWMSQAATIEATGEQLLEIGIGFQRPFNGAELLLILPLGISLHHDPQMFVDGVHVRNYKVDFCLDDGCYSRSKLNAVQLEHFLHMDSAELKLKSGAGKELVLPVSGTGSRAAFNSTAITGPDVLPK
ncbi:MAG: hypothetical protein HKN50_01560 [Gammaproteobacteria bacterium]|nr:hypothetical protein [Gammaproteobacteria bacterium]